MLKVVIIGYGEMFTNMIAGTLDSNSQILGVLRHNRVKYPRFFRWLMDTFNPDCDYNYIKSYNLNEIKVNSANSEAFRKKLISLNPDILLVASWSEKIQKLTFDIPKIATINVHPSILPRYRGPNPYMNVIMNLETESGVTFHLMDEKFDSGAILDQRTVQIDKSDTSKELKAKTVLTARGAVCELFEKLSEDVIFPVSQNESKATYFSTDFNPEVIFSHSAEEISAQIRCIHPWARTYFFVGKYIFNANPYQVTVMENTTPYLEIGTVVDISIKDLSLTVVCGDGQLIRLAGLKRYGVFNQFLTKFALNKLRIGNIIPTPMPSKRLSD